VVKAQEIKAEMATTTVFKKNNYPPMAVCDNNTALLITTRSISIVDRNRFITPLDWAIVPQDTIGSVISVHSIALVPRDSDRICI